MNIMWFCIPAHGHTNPTIEVVRELVRRGHTIRYYSFEPFREQIMDTGAVYISCDEYMDTLSQASERRLKKVSTTEMSIQSFHMTARMDSRLADDTASFRPDLIVTDSACFWGKLTAQKYNLPMVVSCTTFAFNQASARYMKYSFSEIADMVLGIPRLKKESAKLEPLGYHIKNVLDLVQNKNDTDTIVFASERFQPFAETFDKSHYCFVGPSLRPTEITRTQRQRPLIYISLGTVINNQPDFYRHCADAFAGQPLDVLISCGNDFDPHGLDPLPENITIQPYVDQLSVLAEASVFLTHCGMNSASEGLYMGVPEILFPLTGEEEAVARRVLETGAGVRLTRTDAGSSDRIREVVLGVLSTPAYSDTAFDLRKDFISAGGAVRAADFIESRKKQ